MIGRSLSVSEWNDYIAQYDFGPVAPSRLVLHHTFIPNLSQWRGLASMRGMQDYYRQLGWSAAPHIYVAPDGIWLFTPMSQVGIHAGSGNSGVTNGVWWYSIGLEMVGHYDAVRPSGKVWEYARVVMSSISKRLKIAPRQLISFHRDYPDAFKSCPGWAVTHDWVWGEVEAFVNNSTPAPQPPGEIGTPPPAIELLNERLMMESFSQRGTGYFPEWSSHQYALGNQMGMPTGNGGTIEDNDTTYGYQPFARDTLFWEVPKWGEVQRLYDLLGGSIPPSGLGRALLDASFRASGSTFHPEWYAHQYAFSAKLGPAVAEPSSFRLDGTQYGYQVFAQDTLYWQVPQWADIRQLSHLASASKQGDIALREALLRATYQDMGTTYHPNGPFISWPVPGISVRPFPMRTASALKAQPTRSRCMPSIRCITWYHVGVMSAA